MNHDSDGNTASFPSGRRPAAPANGRLLFFDDVQWQAAVIESCIWFFGSAALALIVLIMEAI